MCVYYCVVFFFSSRRRHTRCALVTGVQTCALPILDSTMIGCECIDELADYAGIKAEVAAITQKAMRGEVDFRGALMERVALLGGLAEGVLAECRMARVRLTRGARPLVPTREAYGAHPDPVRWQVARWGEGWVKSVSVRWERVR